MMCWLSVLLCRTACAYSAFVLSTHHGEIEKGVLNYTGGINYVKSCEDMVSGGGRGSHNNMSHGRIGHDVNNYDLSEPGLGQTNFGSGPGDGGDNFRIGAPVTGQPVTGQPVTGSASGYFGN